MSDKLDHPLHRASLYLERLKYGEGPKVVESVSPAAAAAQVDKLLADAGLTHLTTGKALIDAHRYYALSFADSLGRRALEVAPAYQVYGSVFLDGVLHGIALAAGLEADAPE